MQIKKFRKIGSLFLVNLNDNIISLKRGFLKILDIVVSRIYTRSLPKFYHFFLRITSCGFRIIDLILKPYLHRKSDPKLYHFFLRKTSCAFTKINSLLSHIFTEKLALVTPILKDSTCCLLCTTVCSKLLHWSTNFLHRGPPELFEPFWCPSSCNSQHQVWSPCLAVPGCSTFQLPTSQIWVIVLPSMFL